MQFHGITLAVHALDIPLSLINLQTHLTYPTSNFLLRQKRL